MQLASDSLAAPGATPTRSAVFLHGILGTRLNLRSVARRFVEAHPAYEALLLDLRAHGESQGHGGQDTLGGAAEDVVDTVATWPRPVTAVVGHSFGGKVALAVAPRLPGLEHAVLVDSNPGTRLDARGSEATVQVSALLESLPLQWPSREAFVARVVEAGYSKPLAQWLAMNVRRAPGGSFTLHLELPRIRALLDSYFATDLWSLLEGASGAQVHLVVGKQSTVYAPEDLARAHALASAHRSRVTVDVLPTGHWVHTEDLEGLLRVLMQRVPG